MCVPFQAGREREGRTQPRQGVIIVSSRNFSWLSEGEALTGTMNSRRRWQNLIKLINRAALPWVSSGAGRGRKRKCLPVPRASSSPSVSREAVRRAFAGGAGPCPHLESVLQDLELRWPTVLVCPELGRKGVFPEKTREVPGKLGQVGHLKSCTGVGKK